MSQSFTTCDINFFSTKESFFGCWLTNCLKKKEPAMKFLSRLAVLMLCLISMPAFATDTGDVSVQVTDSDVIVNWTGNIDYQGGACCMYFRCYQDSNLVYSREGVGSYSYQYSYPKGWFSHEPLSLSVVLRRKM